MADWFYDGQCRRFLVQFMNVMSNFSYKDAKGQLVQIPVRYGDMNRQVAQILKQNSENTMPSAPFIACWIKDLQFDRPRLQDPTFVSKLHIREREYDEVNQKYLNTQGKNYTIERLMPTPYVITFACDIWTTNLDQKLQILEQMLVLFTPSLEIQSTDNYVDWTSLSLLEIASQTFSSRTVPQGVADDIDVYSATFTAPIWLTPPAKVKKLGIITKIISNVFAVGSQGSIEGIYDINGATEVFSDVSPDLRITVTPGNFDLLVLNGTARLLKPNANEFTIDSPGGAVSWLKLIDMYPGKFRAGLSQLRFTQPSGNEIVATVSLDPSDESTMFLNIDPDTIPGNTVLAGRGSVDAVVDPQTYNPANPSSGTRYLILEDLNINSQFDEPGYDGPDAWKNADSSDFQAHANDIIEWDGSAWGVIFNSAEITEVVYITNAYTGTQYKWSEGVWSKSYEGVYSLEVWRLIL